MSFVGVAQITRSIELKVLAVSHAGRNLRVTPRRNFATLWQIFQRDCRATARERAKERARTCFTLVLPNIIMRMNKSQEEKRRLYAQAISPRNKLARARAGATTISRCFRRRVVSPSCLHRIKCRCIGSISAKPMYIVSIIHRY